MGRIIEETAGQVAMLDVELEYNIHNCKLGTGEAT